MPVPASVPRPRLPRWCQQGDALPDAGIAGASRAPTVLASTVGTGPGASVPSAFPTRPSQARVPAIAVLPQ
ncbi:hypothetical protein [Nonomuraea ceibae]|uniref:hypothetical protein n=1 Tax=Nonomuraea ceibae TaxID=1935170 RepID=UPI001C5E48BA|nr:hypothetical protein [Nonomuraea ceibae]